jgi:Raf kinase inhibitor-like YbhB/YbcL family protein
MWQCARHAHNMTTESELTPRRRTLPALRRVRLLVVAAGVSAALTACGSATSKASEPPASGPAFSAASFTSFSARGPNPYRYLPVVPTFRLTSTTVKNGKPLPPAQLSKLLGEPNGKDISPELSWSGFPKGTKSFVVSMYDPQAPTGSGFWHWVVGNIPATTTRLPANAGAANTTLLPAGAFQLGGDAGADQYVGGAPPAGSGVHDYYLTVTALDVAATGLTDSASGAYLGFAIGAHTIARATIICPTRAPAA